MYHEFFGLTQAPFRITPNTGFFFSGGNRGPVLEALIYAVTHGEGIVKVTGEVGSGKTMLCNMLLERLPQNVESVYVANPGVSPEEILHTIAFDLQLNLPAAASRLDVMRALQDYLLARHAAGRRVVVFVEESQAMPLATLEEVRLLSNLETRHDKLLQIVLFGQPEFDDNLRQPKIRQLRERITHSFTLAPLTAAEIREYLMFRMRAAGYRGPELFSDKVVRLIARASAGLTRRVNLIADKALLAAFAENTHTVKPRHVEAALRDSEFSSGAAGSAPLLRWGWIAAALGGIMLGAAGAVWFGQHNPAPAAAVAAPAPPPAAAPAPAASAVAPTPPAVAAVTPPRVEPPRENTAASNPATVAVPARPDPDVGPTSDISRGDILAQRLAASAPWLAKQNGREWTLQILTSASDDNLREHLETLKKSIEINNIYVYRSPGSTAQKPLYLLFYGNYENQAAAEQQLAEMPAVLKSNRPWPRSVQSIRGLTN